MDLYVQLARKTVETYIRDRKIYEPQPEELTEEMKNGRAGAFVSIHENGELRGCIGTILPTRKDLCIHTGPEVSADHSEGTA